jgi:RimJ/RimL family protein N-acetyltransferase
MTSLTPLEIAERVRRLRESVIIGDCIDMLPYRPEHDAEVVRLRDLPNVRYFLHLTEAPTEAGQAAWRAGYEARGDDVMWLIRDKTGRICGTNRLYDINPVSAEKGSQIVEPDVARVVPAALESEVTIIDLAFGTFNADRVVAQIREDNTQVQSMNTRFGFVQVGATEIRGVPYGTWHLTRAAWNPAPLRAILKHWARRYA